MIYAIVACDLNNGIGKNNSLPWKTLKADLNRFYNLTKDTVVAMGINTYESISVDKRPLKHRIKISQLCD